MPESMKQNDFKRWQREMIAEQAAWDELRIPSVKCNCRQLLPLDKTFKCLYCGIWFCKECAEVHFGKTVEQYSKENPTTKTDESKSNA